jgi:hypothetical protein
LLLHFRFADSLWFAAINFWLIAMELGDAGKQIFLHEKQYLLFLDK